MQSESTLTPSRSSNNLSSAGEPGVNGGLGEGHDIGKTFKSPLLQQFMGSKARGLQSNSPRSGSPQRSDGPYAADSMSDSLIINHHDQLDADVVISNNLMTDDNNADDSSTVIMNARNNNSAEVPPLDFVGLSDSMTTAKSASNEVIATPTHSRVDNSHSFLSAKESNGNVVVAQTESSQWKSSQMSDSVNGIYSSNSHDSDKAFRYILLCVFYGIVANVFVAIDRFLCVLYVYG